MFGKPVSLNLEGAESVNTNLGSCISLLLVITLVAYAGTRFTFLIEKRNPNISVVSLNNYYDSDDKFNFDMGFNIAFGVEEYNSRESKDNPFFVSWSPRMYYFDGDGNTNFTTLTHHRCTDEDFDKKFYKVDPSFQKQFDRVKAAKSLFCLDDASVQPDTLDIYGENDKQRTKALDLVFQHCTEGKCNKNKNAAIKYLE